MAFALTLITFLAGTTQVFGQHDEKKPVREFEMKDGDTTYIMKQYFFGLLLRGESAEEFSKEELQELQAGHMAYMDSIADVGKLKIAGPFGDDTEKRGVVIYDVETLKEAENLAAGDPAVKAGRLKIEIHPWWTAKGSVLD